MKKNILALLIAFVVAVASASADNKAGVGKSSLTTTVDASEVADEGELTYASISRTNPFEIVPAAGMELLGEIDEESENALMVADMISFAKRFLGTRYVRGGKSPKGFDCSGFTSYVFRQFGYSLNASSAGQFSQGEKLCKEEVAPGDLLFFTGRNSRSGRVGHVGIAIANNPETGEITFIHAAIGGGIRIDRISTPYYATRYMGARRVL